MNTPGILRETQIWIAVEMSTGSSSDPALRDTTLAPRTWCHTRDPQIEQNMQSIVRPLSVGRVHVFGEPWVTLKAGRGTRSDMPNADADCFWHSRQWQT